MDSGADMNVDALQAKIKSFRSSRRSPSKGYVSAWSEKEMLNGQQVDSYVMILRTNGCSWANQSGCSVCGYINDCGKGIGSQDIIGQLDKAMERYAGQPVIKLFNSGSFLDDDEVPADARDAVIQRLFETASKVIIETRPEYVTKSALEPFARLTHKGEKCIELAIGLESASDEILKYSVNKGFTVKNYFDAANIIKKAGMQLKTYLLLKPPFLTEAAALADAIASITFAAKHSSTVSLNPVCIQRDTLVNYLWKRREYRPPWLWSVVEALQQGKTSAGDGVRVMSSPTAGGKKRGAHNCWECDAAFLKAIDAFSFSQDVGEFKELECDCRATYDAVLEMEPATFTALDLEKWL
jgi:radical SAM enzyme (TIGR01210 family)